MLNRWGLNVRRGMYVRISLARGGHEIGRVSKFERISGYGWRLILASGTSASIDDAEVRYSLQVETMARHYCIAACWADSEEGTNPRISSAAMVTARARCARFIDAIGPLFPQALARPGYGAHPDCGKIEPRCAAMGHDFYLTSRGHGAGFWDRAELDADGLGDALTKHCEHQSPETYFYRGWLHFMSTAYDRS
ncbi:MAG: hypothetical protein E6Q97_16500 [Desulfurellales bacterium]|nr:MAG: hypothetical protein E6Q97_16500 [Desulfurellales bacterium]